jgi:DNA-binding NtrC family response regulator
MSPLHVLLVDDDGEFRRRVVAFGADLFDLSLAASGGEALEQVRKERPDAVLLDVSLGGGPDGIEVLRTLRREEPDLPVIMVSGDERPETIVEAMRAGANDYVSKHPNLEVLRLKLQRALDHVAWKEVALEGQAATGSELVGASRAMHSLRDEIALVGPRRVRVLIRGESGTGKELVAAALHAASPRRIRRFIAVSGPAGTDDLADSELFGHERGAFTGADRRKIGKFELASGGTLFLDEVGKMSRPRQAKLLRVVETGRFERLGGSEEIAADVRLLSASNEALEGMIRTGRFLEDLYFRLAEYEIRVPPLRDRLDDIPALARFLLDRFARAERLGPVTYNDDALGPLVEHEWPGNVRELDSVLRRAALFAAPDPLTADVIRAAMRARIRAAGAGAEADAADPASGLSSFLGSDYWESRGRLERAFDRAFIERELRRTAGNVTRAAERMGLSRATLNRRRQELGLASADEAPGDD